MKGWTLHRDEISRQTQANTDIQDITEEVRQIVGASQITEGSCLLFAPGATASISTIEFEPGAVADLKDAIERLAPRNLRYAHDERWGDGNGYSHVRAALLGPGLTIPIDGGELELGTWQQIILIDFDNRPRSRRIVVQVSGLSTP